MLDEKFGYADATGKVVIAPQYAAVGPFCEGLAYAKLGAKYGYLDPAGKWVIQPQFDYAYSFSCGRARAGFTAGKSGYLDRTGKLVIPARYASAGEFGESGGKVSLDGFTIYIDHHGREIWKSEKR